MHELSINAQELEQQKAQYLLGEKDSPLAFQRTIGPNEIRERIDPNKTLPSVTLQEEPGPEIKGTLISNKKAIVFNDQTVGTVTITNDTKNKVSFINQIVLEDSYRGKGLGLATYVTVIEDALSRGHHFRTHDWSQSEEAKKIWDKLVDADLAVIKEKGSFLE